jgi:hypothetical protein
MATHEEIYQKLSALGKGKVQCIVATMVSYEKATHTITVQLNNGLKLPGVRLKAAANKSVKFYSIVIPKAKTTVLITQVGETAEAGEYYMLACDEHESIEIKTEPVKYVIKKDGKLYIGNAVNNLSDVLKDLVDAVKDLNILVVGTAGANPLTVTSAKPNPAAVASLTLVSNKLETLLSNKDV